MVLKVKDLQVKYGKFQVFSKPISFQIEPKEVFFIIGPSGSGKTSLLKSILGTIGHQGTIEIEGSWGYLDVKNYFELQWSVKDNYQFYYRVYEVPEDPSVYAFLQTYEPGVLHKNLKDCSYGTMRRLALYRTLFENKDFYILDEPTTGNDLKNIKTICDVLNQFGKTYLIVSHEPNLTKEADQLLVLSEAPHLIRPQDCSKGYVELPYHSSLTDFSDLGQLVYSLEKQDRKIYQVDSYSSVEKLKKQGFKVQWNETQPLKAFLSVYHLSNA